MVKENTQLLLIAFVYKLFFFRFKIMNSLPFPPFLYNYIDNSIVFLFLV
jgi:hypothetical protein